MVIGRGRKKVTEIHKIDHRRVVQKAVITVFCSTQEAGHLKNLETGPLGPPSLLSSFSQHSLSPYYAQSLPLNRSQSGEGASSQLCSHKKHGAEGDPASSPRAAVSAPESFQPGGSKATTRRNAVCPRGKTLVLRGSERDLEADTGEAREKTDST